VTPVKVVVVNEGAPAVSAKLARAFAEDAVAIASWAAAHGFEEDAAAMREFAVKVWSGLNQARRAAG
jgi:hypothetical protein